MYGKIADKKQKGNREKYRFVVDDEVQKVSATKHFSLKKKRTKVSLSTI